MRRMRNYGVFIVFAMLASVVISLAVDANKDELSASNVLFDSILLPLIVLISLIIGAPAVIFCLDMFKISPPTEVELGLLTTDQKTEEVAAVTSSTFFQLTSNPAGSSVAGATASPDIEAQNAAFAATSPR